MPAALAAAVKWWPDTPIGRMMLIPLPKSPEEVLPETENYRGLKNLVGKRGTARGLMLPSGIVLIDNKPYDAVSEGMTIEAGQNVLVVAVSTQRLVVRPDTHDPRRTGRTRGRRDFCRSDGSADRRSVCRVRSGVERQGVGSLWPAESFHH